MISVYSGEMRTSGVLYSMRTQSSTGVVGQREVWYQPLWVNGGVRVRDAFDMVMRCVCAC